MDELNELIYDRVHNKKWFTARGLDLLSQSTGQNVELIAKVICGFLFILLIGNNNWIVCNTILVVVPLLLTYVYPDEKPPVSNMRVYWMSAFLMTAFDRMLETFPLYYVIKLAILLFLLVEPSCLNERLKKLFKISENISTRSEGSVQEETPKLEESPSQQSRGSAISPSTAVVGKSRSESQQKSPTLGAPTPYDTKPLSQPEISTVGSESIAKASIAQGPPVGVGEKREVESVYFNIPKPVTKDAVLSMRAPPKLSPESSVQQKPSQVPPGRKTPRKSSKRR
ncbi:hypothetical protein V3C99_006589 [Haemonchus contortus]